MPNMANITVKNVALADVIYVASSPSAGDRVPAKWSQNALSGRVVLRPTLTLVAADNAAGDVRRFNVELVYPIGFTDSATGLQQKLAETKFSGVFFCPKSLQVTDWQEAFTQLGNLLSSALVRQAITDNSAPT